MKPIVVSSSAGRDLNSASSFYAEQDNKLAVAFLDEFEHVSLLISESPDIGSPVGDGNRKIVMRRFPFIVIYRHEPDRIIILVVGHQRRHPDHWLDRK